MDNLLQSLRYSFRTLFKNKGFTYVAVITLALGIGPNIAIFSVINATLLRPLPYEKPDSLVKLMGSNTKIGLDRATISAEDLRDYREQNQVFEDMAALWQEYFNITAGDKPEAVLGDLVTANFFSVLGAEMSPGRAFLPGEDQPGSERVVIISHGLWVRRFGGSADLIGKTISINGSSFTLVGIAPPGIQTSSQDPELWIPLVLDGSDIIRKPSALSAEEMKKRNRRFLNVIGRLKPGADIKQSQVEMASIAARLEQQYPDTNASWSVNVISMRDYLVGDIRPVLLILFSSVALILLIACTNVANLLIARGAARTKEIAIRMALGANRFHLVRQLLTESLTLALLGGLLGLGLAYLCLKFLAIALPEDIPLTGGADLNWTVLIFTILISILSGVIFGLAPALRFSKADLNETLKEGGKDQASGLRSRFRNLLVISEMALALVLLIAAGLMIKSLWLLGKVNPGFDPKNILTLQIHLPQPKYPEGRQKADFYRQMLQKTEVLPGVRSVATTIAAPLVAGRNVTLRFTIDGRAPSSPAETPAANYRAISHNYFDTLGIQFLMGRDFTERDRETAPGVIIINEALARRYFPDEDPLGHHVTLNFGPPVRREIIGVVANVKPALDGESGAEMYVPFLQTPWAAMVLMVRTSSEPKSLTNSILDKIRSLDPEQSVSDVRTEEEIISNSVSSQRFSMLLLIIFAGVAQILSAIGIYGVIAYTVTQRTHEIGIRMALGAKRYDVLKLILGQGMGLALVGVGIGLVAAFGATRVMSSLLYGVSTTDPITFAFTSLVLCAVALLATFIPAHRATSINPLEALRHE